MNKGITASIMALALGACAADEGRVAEVEDDRANAIIAGLTDIFAFVGAEAGSFVAGEIFGLTLPEDAATLSQESLDEIEFIVDSSVREAALTDHNGELNAVVERFNRYARASCEGGVGSTPSCKVDELNEKREEARDISDDALTRYDVYLSWVTSTGNQEVKTDSDWQVFLSKNIQLAMALDMAMLREIYEIERLRKLSTASDTWSTIQRNAGDYLDVLDTIKYKYDDIVDRFGDVEIVEQTETTYDGITTTWRACFDTPEDKPMCSSQERTTDCYGAYCTTTGATLQQLQEEIREVREERLERFEQLVLGSPSEFDEVRESLETIQNRPFVPFEFEGGEFTCKTIQITGAWSGFGGTYTLVDGKHDGKPAWSKHNFFSASVPLYILWRDDLGKWVMQESTSKTRDHYYETEAVLPYGLEWTHNEEYQSAEDYPISSATCTDWI